jgi:hypothetical protein
MGERLLHFQLNRNTLTKAHPRKYRNLGKELTHYEQQYEQAVDKIIELAEGTSTNQPGSSDS